MFLVQISPYLVFCTFFLYCFSLKCYLELPLILGLFVILIRFLIYIQSKVKCVKLKHLKSWILAKVTEKTENLNNDFAKQTVV